MAYQSTGISAAVCVTPVVTMDLYPTILELAGLPLNREQHRDGVSLTPLLKGQPISSRKLYWHYPHYGNQGGAPCGSVRDGDWKLIEWYEDGLVELFNLREDESETTNLAGRHPDKVSELAAELAAWRLGVNAVMPLPNPEYRGK